MNEEHTPITNEMPVSDKQQDWKHHFITVTPLSKILAMLLFIILPFAGFGLGVKYGSELSNMSVISPTPPIPEEQDPGDETATVWRYSPSTTVPENWQTLEDKTMGFAISYPDQFAHAAPNEEQSAYVVCDTSLPLKPNPYPDPNEIKTACTGFQTMFTVYARDGIVTQELIDTWGNEVSNETKTEVHGREVWTLRYGNAVDSGLSVYVNSPSTDSAIALSFTRGAGSTPGLANGFELNNLGQQTLDTLTIVSSMSNGEGNNLVSGKQSPENQVSGATETPPAAPKASIADWETYTDVYYSGISFRHPPNVQVTRGKNDFMFELENTVTMRQARLQVQALTDPVLIMYDHVAPIDWVMYEPMSDSFYRIPAEETYTKSYALYAQPTTIEPDFTTDLQVRNAPAPVYITGSGDAGWSSRTYKVIQRDELLPVVAEFSTSYQGGLSDVREWLDTLETIIRTFGRGVDSQPCIIAAPCKG